MKDADKAIEKAVIAGDADKAKEIVLNVLKNSKYVLQDPAPSVYITNLGDSAVELMALPYCTVADYWDVYFETHENAKEALDAAGIEIPYPHAVEIQKEG